MNLEDKIERFHKVTKQFLKQKIKYNRFLAVDGRCNKKNKKECEEKKKMFEKQYKIKISKKLETTAASHTIGMLEMLKMQIKNKWENMLICEDDIVLNKNLNDVLKDGIKELKKVVPNWDILYLGCGNQCGIEGISYDKTKENKYKTSMSIISKEYDWYVSHKDDLRTPCDDCKKISKLLTIPSNPGGNWCHAFSLKGAKKLVKYIDNDLYDHTDQMLGELIRNNKFKIVAFDSPIVNHEAGALRPDSDIVWEF